MSVAAVELGQVSVASCRWFIVEHRFFALSAFTDTHAVAGPETA